MKIGNLVLLTGAGFTSNFGGYLGQQMFSEIIGCPQIHRIPRVKQAFLDSGNYETTYTDIMKSSNYSEQEKLAVREAVFSTYRELHSVVVNFRGPSPQHFNIKGGFNSILQLFNKDNSCRCFMFTLNQDLFLEYWCSQDAPAQTTTPEDVPIGRRIAGKEHVSESDFITLPKERSIDEVKKAIENHVGPPYIKLHGSYGWLSSDGKERLVLGSDKIEQIRDEPLLHCYLQLFNEVLTKGDPKSILIIGYSFGDRHINDGLVKAIENGSTWFIINPRKDEIQFREWLNRRENISESDRKILLSGLVKYFQYSLRDFLYDYNTPEWKRIAQAFTI